MCSHRDQIDEGHCVIIDAPQRHDADRIHDDHDYGDQVEQTGAQIQTQQQTAHHEGGQQAQGDVEEPLWDDGQVLLVKYISHPGGRREDKYWSENTVWTA